jgi:hypothetical protein
VALCGILPATCTAVSFFPFTASTGVTILFFFQGHDDTKIPCLICLAVDAVAQINYSGQAVVTQSTTKQIPQGIISGFIVALGLRLMAYDEWLVPSLV